MLDFRFQTFLTLCETMNYRRAAERLHITQPTVTQHIQFLENYYHCKLFSYAGRRLSMTPHAVTLQKYANSIRYQEHRLMADLQPSGGCYLKVGATKTVGDYVIPPHVIRFLGHRDNNIFLEVGNTRQILSLLDRGEIDFGIIEGHFDRSAYTKKLYREEPFIGFCSKTHPFAHRTVTLDALLAEDLVIREEGSGTREILSQALLDHNCAISDFRRVIRVNQFHLLQALVANNCGVTFAYQAAGAAHPDLAPFSVEGWDLKREFNYVCLPNAFAQQQMELFDSYRIS